MKVINLIVFVLVVISLWSCTYSYDKTKEFVNKPRIQVLETSIIEGEAYYIIKADSVLMFVSGHGGVLRLK